MTITAEAVAAAADSLSCSGSLPLPCDAAAVPADHDASPSAATTAAVCTLQLELPRSSSAESESAAATSTSASSSPAHADSASRPLTPPFAVQHASDAASRPSSSNGAAAAAAAATQSVNSASVAPIIAAAALPSSPAGVGSSAHSREEQVVALLSAKKRALLCEIGALLTLRERLHAEMASAAASGTGVPFDYAVRFAHSPTTLQALEQAADAWRAERRREEEEEMDAAALTQAVAAAAYLGGSSGIAEASAADGVMMSPQARAASTQRLTLAQPRMHHTPSPARAASSADSSMHTPSRLRAAAAATQPSVASAPQAAIAAARPHTAPSSRSAASFSSPLGAMYSPIKEHDEEANGDSDPDAVHENASASFASFCDSSVLTHQQAPVDHGPALVADLYNGTGIEHEESLFFDSLVLDGEEVELQLDPAGFAEPTAQRQVPPRTTHSLLRSSAGPADAYAPVSSARTQQQRPYTAQAASYQHYQQQQQHHSQAQAQQYSRVPPQSQQPHTSRVYSHASGYATAGSSNINISSPASHGSDAHAPGQAPLGYLAQKALAKQHAAEESLRSFRGQTLRGVASEALERENVSLKEHYPNFQAIPQQKYEPVHGAGRSPATAAGSSRHSTPSRISMASPARARHSNAQGALQNITNTANARDRATHSASKLAPPPSNSGSSHVTPLKQRTRENANSIRW